MKYWPLFVLGAVVCWGAYVPTIHHGQLGFGGKNTAIRAFLFVGLAYFLVAVLVPIGMLVAKAEPAEFAPAGIRMSVAAGVFGALGAFCVIMSFKTGGKPLYVAPLIFAGAPVVNTIVSMVWDKPAKPPGVWFYAGILLAAAGAAMVLRFKPT